MSAVIAGGSAALGWLFATVVTVGALTTAAGWTPHPLVAGVQGAAPRIVPIGVLLGVLLVAASRDLSGVLLPGAVLLTGVTAWTILLLPAGSSAQSSGEPGLRILSTNLLITNTDVAEIAQDIISADPDVLITVETTEVTRETLKDHLTSYQVKDTGRGARGSWATVWVHERASARVDDGADGIEAGAEYLPGVRFRVGPAAGEVIHIVGVHLHAPSTAKGISLWQAEFADLTRHAATGGERLVLGGDFNAGRSHPVAKELFGLLGDAGRTPWGSGTPTWPVLGRSNGLYRFLPPLLDLDHILVGPGLASRNYRTVGIHGSDHLGVITDVSLRRP